MGSDSFIVWQSRLPYRLGIDVQQVRELRRQHLVEGRDWMLRGNRIMFTEMAVTKLMKILKCALPANKTASENDFDEKDGPAPVPEEKTPWKPSRPLVVHNPKVKNRRIVEVRFEDEPENNGHTGILRVRDNSAFRIDTRIQPEDYEIREPGLYDFVGRRAPQR